MEGDQSDAIGMKLMLRGYREVKETVGTSRVDKGADWCSWKDVGGNGDHKGVWIVKSGCIELWLHWCTSEFNAVLSWCRDKRTAYRFFDSKPDLASEVLSVLVTLSSRGSCL